MNEGRSKFLDELRRRALQKRNPTAVEVEVTPTITLETISQQIEDVIDLVKGRDEPSLVRFKIIERDKDGNIECFEVESVQ